MADRSAAKRQIDRERVERNIYRRLDRDGRPVFEVVFRDSDGRQHRQRVTGGVMAARAVRANIEARKAGGERVAPRPRLTFEQAAEGWWAAQAAQLRPTTRAAYRHCLNDHLLPAWGRRRLDTLTASDVAELIAAMQTVEYRQRAEARSGRPTRRVSVGYATWTIRGVLTVSGRIFEFARRRMGWGAANPVRELDRGERPRGEQRERRVLSGDELGRLLNAADEPYRLLFAFAAGTGTRLGEALGVRWRDIDLAAGTVSITHQLDRHGERVALKTQRSKRIVDLPGSLASALREQLVRSPRSRPGDYVFVGRTGEPHDHRNAGGRALARAVRRAGLDGAEGRITFHTLRHSYASAWIASGGDLVELSRTLGHRDPAITASTYSHEFERATRSDERRARLDSMFGSKLATPDRSAARQTDMAEAGNVADLQAKRAAPQ